MHELINLWTRLLGEPPDCEQFALWGEMHPVDVVRRGVLKTAAKNLSVGKTMSHDHKIRFASKVMSTLTEQAATNAANKTRLREEYFTMTGVTEVGVKSATRGSNA
jgi:hypothetical protein